MSNNHRRYLVIVRAGQDSLHRRWLQGGRRNWDLVVSWYDAAPYVPVVDERVLRQPGGKWDVLAAQFAAHPELLDYDYIWVPDDDIDTDCATINRLFELTAAYGLWMSQPALTADSYYSHLHTLQCPSFELRFTNFVEVMAPCMSRASILRTLPLMPASPTGHGLDFVWGRLEDDNHWRSAIIDAAPVRHTRPVGQFLMKRMRQAGMDPVEIEAAIRKRFGVGNSHQFHCYAGTAHSGRRRGQFETWLLMVADFVRSRRRRIHSGPPRVAFNYFRYGYRPTPLFRLVDRDEPRR